MTTRRFHSDREADRQRARENLAQLALIAVASAIAVAGARHFAGGWNDGSRLATVEALVDYHTLAIDESIFVRVPWPSQYGDPPAEYRKVPWFRKLKSGEPFPYPLDYPNAWIGDGRHAETIGTRDKVRIGGRYYSHKPPVPAILMAPWYYIVQKLSGLTARTRCDAFCYWMTLGTAGVSYVLTLLCNFRLGRLLEVPLNWRLALTASLGFSTVTVAYLRGVNDHIMLLAVASGLALALTRLGQWATRAAGEVGNPTRLMAIIGTLAGVGYTIDQATGPAILLSTSVLVAYRVRGRWLAIVVFVAAALPWLSLHHAVNYVIGGTFVPIGSIAEFFDWPGSTFDRRNMTGYWNHASAANWAIYMYELTVAPLSGFLPHNMPLLASIPGLFALACGRLRQPTGATPELIWGAAWCLATWFVYGALSSNYSGDCCSVRWFVPFLAVGYHFMAVLVKGDERYQAGLLLFSGLGVPLAYFEWLHGPWLEPAKTDPGASWFIVLEMVALAIWPLWIMWVWIKRPRL